MVQLAFSFFEEVEARSGRKGSKKEPQKIPQEEELPFQKKEEIVIFNSKGDKTVILTDKAKEGNMLFFVLNVCREYTNGTKAYVDKHLWKSFHEAKADLEVWKSFAHMSDW